MFSKTVIPLDDRDEFAAILPPVSSLLKAVNGEAILLTVLDEDEFESGQVELRAVDGPTPVHGELLAPIVGAYIPMSSSAPRTGVAVSLSESVGAIGPQAVPITEAILRLETHAKELRRDGITVTVKVTHGDPEEEILRVITDEGADSLAIATHKQSAIARTITGSLADALMQSSPVPVMSMLVPDDAESGPTSRLAHVIVPVDGTEFGELAVEPAIGLALTLDAKLLFVQAITSPAFASTAAAVPEIVDATEKTMEEMTVAAEIYMATLVKKAETAGVKAVATSHVGSAGSVIVSIANSHEDSIVVMASHARSGLSRTIQGSNADEVMRNLTSPLIVIKDGDNE